MIAFFIRSVVELLEWNVTFAQDAKIQNDFQDTIHQSSSSKQGTDANIFPHFFVKLNYFCISRVFSADLLIFFLFTYIYD